MPVAPNAAEAHPRARAEAQAAVPRCTAPARARFPLATRVSGGPVRYVPGGGPGTFRIVMRNEAHVRCAAVHPVLVLLDRRKELRPGRLRVRFRDPDGTWRPVRFRHTGPGENVGVFAAPGFHGYALRPSGAVSVPVEMRFAKGAVGTGGAGGGNSVRASVSSVQRRGADGEWVGESPPYRFSVGEDGR